VEKLRTSDLPEKSFDKMPVNSYRMGIVCNMVFRCIDCRQKDRGSAKKQLGIFAS
jgi:hypothetical protein